MKNTAFCLSMYLIGASPLFADVTLTLNSGEFDLHDSGTVTDALTHLTWQSCAVGQTWELSTRSCTGNAQVFSYANAMKITSDFADKTDWRLPNIYELNSILNLKTYDQPAEPFLFPQAPTDRGFISSTLYLPKAQSLVWMVLANSGNKTPAGAETHDGYYVRLVRGYMPSVKTPATQSAANHVATQVDLTVTLNVSANPAKRNRCVDYTIDVLNKSVVGATDATVSFYLAPNLMRYESASTYCEKKGDNVICQLGDLGAGEHTSKTIKVAMQKVGALSSSVFVKANETDANESDNQAQLMVSVKK